ncbi:hypothetical protein [Streptomyces sp. NPDC001642]|uniref:hypothetical protein n=1 Tax=Streptomyces sp. NPDC001642 TaxID=3154392 RepID=UPI00331A9CD8
MDIELAREAADVTSNGFVIRIRKRAGRRAVPTQDHIGEMTAMYDRRVQGARLTADMPLRLDYALWLPITGRS